MSTQDFTPEELEFRRKLQPDLAAIARIAGPCPQPDLLMAAQSGVLGLQAESIERHVRLCPACTQLRQDLSSYEFPGVSKSEHQRIASQWSKRSSSFTWMAWAIPATAVMTILGVGLWFNRTPAPASAPITPVSKTPASTTAPAPSPAPLLLAFEKAPIRIPTNSVLIFRGDSKTGEKYLKDLAAALDPYRAGDYAEAERRLAQATRDYPGSAESAFYLGISQLLLGENDRAIESLNAARAHADETLRDSLDWYSTVALNHAGQNAAAVRQAETLCSHQGEFKQKACAAATEIQPK